MNARTIGLIAAAAGLALLARNGGCKIDLPSPGPKLVILLHEAQNGPLPPYAIGAVNELTAAGVQARMVDDDITDGAGEVPDWLKPALEPGRAIMGQSQQDDSLVVLQGSAVVKAVKLPESKEAILEAVK